MNGPRWMMPGWVYAYRCRKPGAILGLPFLGRHWAYGGQTRNPRMRHVEHTQGGGRYGKEAASWSDLRPRRYVIFYLPMCPQWLLDLVERLVILLIWPVYNDRMNRWNPRRIPRRVAAAQRRMRDGNRLRWSWNITWGHVIVLVVLVIVVARALQL